MRCEAILDQCWRENPRSICITGGEPLLQIDELSHLIPSLARRGTAIDIETNGTIAFTAVQPYASICMDVKCPSSGEESEPSLLAAIRPEDSVKFVVANEEDCRYARDVMEHHPIAGAWLLCPVYGTDDQPLVDYILRNNLPVRFQIQRHKVLGVK